MKKYSGFTFMCRLNTNCNFVISMWDFDCKYASVRYSYKWNPCSLSSSPSHACEISYLYSFPHLPLSLTTSSSTPYAPSYFPNNPNPLRIWPTSSPILLYFNSTHLLVYNIIIFLSSTYPNHLNLVLPTMFFTTKLPLRCLFLILSNLVALYVHLSVLIF